MILTRNIISSFCSNSSYGDEQVSDEDVFQLLFLYPENQTVEAWETNSVELKDLISHLRSGGSVFISSKKQNRSSTGYLDEEMKKPTYFKRI